MSTAHTNTAPGAFDPRGFVPQPPANEAEGLRALLDKQEIHEVLMRYCRALDRLDEQMLRTVVQPDSVWVRGTHVVRGPDVVPDLLNLYKRGDSTTGLHTICNELIEVYGDVALSECYWISYSTGMRDGQEYASEVAGRYVDRWERREDRQWKIAHRTFLVEWMRSEPAAKRDLGRDFKSGLRSREDVSYRTL
jgi:ketosteroid isomerase-like protein